jgi:hypothetical protein
MVHLLVFERQARTLIECCGLLEQDAHCDRNEDDDENRERDRWKQSERIA